MLQETVIGFLQYSIVFRVKDMDFSFTGVS